MADLDTRSKRASSVNLLSPWALDLVLPDGTLNQGDRQHSAWDYSGILAGGAPVVTTQGWEAITFGYPSTQVTPNTGITLGG